MRRFSNAPPTTFEVMPYPDHPQSYYAATARALTSLAPLTGEHSTDVGIVGGGYTGLSCALHLAQRGYDVALLEAQRVGWGASGRNGGQLSGGQRKDQDTLERWFGVALAHQLWELGEASKALVKDLIDRHAISCDLKPGILNAAHKPALAEAFWRYAEKLQQDYGYAHAEPVAKAEMHAMVASADFHGGYLDRDAAHLHPLNFALGLARAATAAGARIFEATRVTSYSPESPFTVDTAGGGRLHCRFLVLACNGYLDTLEPRLAGRIMPINNYILATAPLGEEHASRLIRDDVAVADSRFVIDYFRLSADRRLLFGGGESYRRRFPADLKALVRRAMLRLFPQLANVAIDYAWGGTLAVTRTRMPHFGRLTPELYFAHGYSGQGLGMATLAGQLIAEAVAGTAERFDVFARLPPPRFPGGRFLRWPGLVAGMLYYALRDRL